MTILTICADLKQLLLFAPTSLLYELVVGGGYGKEIKNHQHDQGLPKNQ